MVIQDFTNFPSLVLSQHRHQSLYRVYVYHSSFLLSKLTVEYCTAGELRTDDNSVEFACFYKCSVSGCIYIVIFTLIFRGNRLYSMQGIWLHSKEIAPLENTSCKYKWCIGVFVNITTRSGWLRFYWGQVYMGTESYKYWYDKNVWVVIILYNIDYSILHA
jgi:hypothetical protein